MSPHAKVGIAGVIIGLILLIWAPWVALGVVAAAIILPAVAWAMLSPGQRQRIRGQRRRRSIGG
jgi:hypothetical protein